MAFRSMNPRLLDGPGASSTASQRKGILPMKLLTVRSIGRSASRISGGVRGRYFAPHEVHRRECRRIRAFPTTPLNTDTRWVPPYGCTFPLCWRRRPQRVLLAPALSACVPTRTTRLPVPEWVRTSPRSMKKYTPRSGHDMRPEQSAKWRAPPTRCAIVISKSWNCRMWSMRDIVVLSSDSSEEGEYR